jgi:Putative MetA-pathway of phenol degradation
MCKRLLFVCLALAVLRAPEQLYAQFTDPHNYDNAPLAVNQLELAYAYAHSDASTDTALIIAGAKFNLNQGIIDYTHYFGLVRRLWWVEATLPVAGLGGSVSGTNISGSITGLGDSSYTVAALLKGGPALSVAQFENYKPTTIVGGSLTITVPSGLYNPNKLLNLGSNRWSFNPQFAVSHPFGPEQKWQFDAYANAAFFTHNTSYQRAKIFRQQLLPGLQGHISYSLAERLWASLDTRYSFGGNTFVNSVNQNNAQQNFILGSELNVSINNQNSFVFEFAKPLVHRNGPTYTGFAVKYDYVWGKGYN